MSEEEALEILRGWTQIPWGTFPHVPRCGKLSCRREYMLHHESTDQQQYESLPEPLWIFSISSKGIEYNPDFDLFD